MIDYDGRCLVCGMEDVNENHEHDAEIIRDGSRGHYLAPTFVLDAYAILGRAEDDLSESAERWLAEMSHPELGWEYPADSATEDDYGYVTDAMLNLESDLASAGFVVHMEDGYMIWKVENDASI